MSQLIQAAALGLAGAFIAVLLKKTAPELGLAVTIAVCIAAAGLALGLFRELKDIVELAGIQTGLSPAVVSPVLKCVGIGIVTRLAGEMCKDAGQGAVAAAVELCGTVCAMVTALPMIRALMDLIGSLA